MLIIYMKYNSEMSNTKYEMDLWPYNNKKKIKLLEQCLKVKRSTEVITTLKLTQM